MVKRYEPCHKWYAYDNEPTLEMQESAYGEYVKLETFQHEMARLQAQIDRMRKERQHLEAANAELLGLLTGVLKEQFAQPSKARRKIMLNEFDLKDWDKIDCDLIRKRINDIEWQVLPDLGTILEFVDQVELIRRKQVKQIAVLLKGPE